MHQQLAIARVEREVNLGHAGLVADPQLDDAAFGRSMDAAAHAFAHTLDDSFRIGDKLGFASRTHIGVWAAERELVISGPS
ncbi:MAG: hypothetical protein JO352_09480 [Chloroflexi bacterium]|nr:hypothetical protein [Chloroflexota bacterium]MBV9596535.1 hypothetical protein [Chloroflexota bacterium]